MHIYLSTVAIAFAPNLMVFFDFFLQTEFSEPKTGVVGMYVHDDDVEKGEQYDEEWIG